MCVCVCVCVRERDRDRETDREGVSTEDRERDDVLGRGWGLRNRVAIYNWNSSIKTGTLRTAHAISYPNVRLFWAFGRN